MTTTYTSPLYGPTEYTDTRSDDEREADEQHDAPTPCVHVICVDRYQSVDGDWEQEYCCMCGQELYSRY